MASNTPPTPHEYLWHLTPYCNLIPACNPSEYCVDGSGSVFYRIQVQPIAQPGPSPEDSVIPPEYPMGGGFNFRQPFEGTEQAGQPYGEPIGRHEGCVDISQLGQVIPPLPEEAAVAFAQQALRELEVSYQPPDLGFVNFPEIFYTTGQTTAQYVVDIRGFTVTLDAEITEYHWYPGEPGAPYLVGDDPGAPYPDQTVTHTYAQPGSYAVQLETIWTATYSYDAEGPFAVPGSRPSVGPEAQVEIGEARPVLIDPND